MEEPGSFEARARQALPPFFAPLEVARSLPTTMARAAELAAAGAPEGATVLADEQTAGRGRLERRWLAPAGSSLLLSVVLRPALARDEVWLVALAAGVALVDAARELLPAGVPVALKWPNDLLVGGVKAAGLLAEARPATPATPAAGGTPGPPKTLAGGQPAPAAAGGGHGLTAVLLGMGVNVSQQAGDFPPELAGRATSLALAVAAASQAGGAPGGAPVDRVALLGGWGRHFVARYGRLAAGRGGEVLAAYRERLDTLGRRVRAERLDGPPLTGVAVDLGRGGGLVVRTDVGATVTLTAADVEHLHPGDHPGDPG